MHPCNTSNYHSMITVLTINAFTATFLCKKGRHLKQMSPGVSCPPQYIISLGSFLLCVPQTDNDTFLPYHPIANSAVSSVINIYLNSITTSSTYKPKFCDGSEGYFVVLRHSKWRGASCQILRCVHSIPSPEYSGDRTT